MGNIPELRFSEFVGEWNTKNLQLVCQMQAGKFVAASEIYEHSSDDLFPCYGGNGLRGYTKTYTHKGKCSLIGRQGALCGNITSVSGKFHATEHAIVTTPINDTNTEWLFYKLVILDLNRYATGQAQPGLSVKNLEKIPLIAPQDKKEQQKIAYFLSSVDNKISLLTEKQILLQRYKKGVMQKLFSQELRFKDDQGNDFPEWEEKEIGDCLTIGSGRDYKHLKEGSIPVYGTGGFMLNVNEFLYEGESVCIGRKGTIDKPMFLNGKFWTVDTLFYSHSYKDNLPKFLFYIFLQINWKKYNEASGVPSLSKKTIEKIKVKIPNPDEQQKIANFLSEIDKKTDSVNQQIEQTKTFKKGLLQQMFV